MIDSERDLKGPVLWGWHTYVSIGVTAVIFLILARMIDPDELRRELSTVDFRLLFLGGLAHYATYGIRGWRWRRTLLHLQAKGGTARFALIVFFYNFVDNVVPAKLADIYAAHLVRINCGVRRSAALGSLVFLRTVDAWLVLLAGFVASWVLFASAMSDAVVWSLLGGGVIAVLASAILLLFVFLGRSTPRWLPEKVLEMVEAFRTAMWPRASDILPVVLLTAFIWGLETLWIVLLGRAFDLRLGPAEALFLTMVPVLASAFPFTPSGAGAVEVTLFSCLRLLHASSPVAISFTIANRLVDYWLHILLGTVVWALRRGVGLRTWSEAPPEGEPDVGSGLIDDVGHRR